MRLGAGKAGQAESGPRGDAGQSRAQLQSGGGISPSLGHLDPFS